MNSVLALFLVLPALCFAERWQVFTYYPTGGGCTSDVFYQTVTRVEGDSCSGSQCVSAGGVSVSSCCSSTSPTPTSQQMAWTWRDGTSTCEGGSVISTILYPLERCIGFAGSFVKYSRTGDNNVTVLDGCTDSSCTTGCSTSIFQLGCNTYGLSNNSYSWKFEVGTGSGSRVQCDSSSGNNNVEDTGAGSSIGPLLVLIVASLFGAAFSIY